MGRQINENIAILSAIGLLLNPEIHELFGDFLDLPDLANYITFQSLYTLITLLYYFEIDISARTFDHAPTATNF